MLDRGQGQRLSISRRLGGGSQRRIFGFEPPQQHLPFFRARRDERDPPGRGEKGHGWRIDDLENVETERVPQERGGDKSGERQSSPARLIPGEDEIEIALGTQGSAHLEGVVARATEAIPCSRARFVTSTTSV